MKNFLEKNYKLVYFLSFLPAVCVDIVICIATLGIALLFKKGFLLGERLNMWCILCMSKSKMGRDLTKDEKEMLFKLLK